MSMTSPIKFYHVTQIILYMWSCDQNLITLACSMREVILTSILKGLDQKNHFFEGWSWFKFNNLGLTRDTNLKFHTSVARGLKLKVRKFWGLIPYVCLSYR